MKEIREIGLEKEMFLLKGDEIIEPKLFGFPFDCFGFLIELRSLPSDRLFPVITTLEQEELQYKLRANKFGMNLKAVHQLSGNRDFVKYLVEKYDAMSAEDRTKNIYGTRKSHNLGIESYNNLNVFDFTEDYYRLTSGIHVHFSSRNSETGEVINLNIEKIVKEMDKEFYSEVMNSGRNLGEWEPKTHGFEYRSLPCNADVYKILKVAFKILREA